MSISMSSSCICVNNVLPMPLWSTPMMCIYVRDILCMYCRVCIAMHIWNRELLCSLRGQIYSYNFPCIPSLWKKYRRWDKCYCIIRVPLHWSGVVGSNHHSAIFFHHSGLFYHYSQRVISAEMLCLMQFNSALAKV